jgi:hypothetical protein
MKPLAIFTLAACAFAAVLGGCADRLPTRVAAPSADRNGATIVRPSVVFGLAFGGGPMGNGLGVSVGIEDPVASLAAVCADPSLGSPLSPGKSQFVVTPSGNVPNHSVTTDAAVAVFAVGSELVTSPCQLTSENLVATGTARFVTTENDLSASSPGSFVEHATVKGTVTLTSGGQALLFGELQLVQRPDGTVVIDREVVRLTPL